MVSIFLNMRAYVKNNMSAHLSEINRQNKNNENT